MIILCPETLRLMRLMYNQEEFEAVCKDMEDSDGWLIIPFNKYPVLEPIEDKIPRMLAKVLMYRFIGEDALPDYRLN